MKPLFFVVVVSLLFVVAAVAQTTDCGTAFIGDCISSAIVDVCGVSGTKNVTCICGSSGVAELETVAGFCLYKSCPPSQLLSLLTAANSACGSLLSSASASGSRLSASSTPSSSTKFTSSGTGTSTEIAITSPATLPAQSSARPILPPPPALPTGAKVGIAVSASITLVALLFGVGLCLYRRRGKRKPPPDAHELQAWSRESATRQDKPDSPVDVSVMEMPFRELHGDDLAPLYRPGGLVEADSRSARSGHPSGGMAGTEATAFDFDSQKVLLEPDLNLPHRGRNG